MKTSVCILLLALQSVSGFAPAVRPVQGVAPLLATPEDDVSPGATLRKRDRVKHAVKSAFGLSKSTSEEDDSPELVGELESTTPKRRKMQKAKNGKKYAKIECLEEKAYQILKDLDMIETYE